MTIKQTPKNGLMIETKTADVKLEEQSISIVPDGNEEKNFTITTPGEFEVSGIAVFSFDPFPAFLIEAEQIAVAYLPNPPEKFDETTLTELERVDILLMPGKRSDFVQSLAPFIVIPLNDSDTLVQSLKKETPESTKTLTVKSRAELPEETEVVILVS
jgi:hypothetical protein